MAVPQRAGYSIHLPLGYELGLVHAASTLKGHGFALYNADRPILHGCLRRLQEPFHLRGLCGVS